MARQRKRNNSIKALYSRERMLRSRFLPGSLKLTLMGFTRRGGAPLRVEKLRRKLPKQMTGVRAKEHIRPINE